MIAARALGLTADGAVNLFAIGRTVGWIVHAIEQYQRDHMIRTNAAPLQRSGRAGIDRHVIAGAVPSGDPQRKLVPERLSEF